MVLADPQLTKTNIAAFVEEDLFLNETLQIGRLDTRVTERIGTLKVLDANMEEVNSASPFMVNMTRALCCKPEEIHSPNRTVFIFFEVVMSGLMMDGFRSDKDTKRFRYTKKNK